MLQWLYVLLLFSALSSSYGSILICYAHSSHSQVHIDNTLFFLHRAVPRPLESGSCPAHVSIVSNGEARGIQDALLMHADNPCFKFFVRANVGFDFGAWYEAVLRTPEPVQGWKYYVFLNASVRGPLVSSVEPLARRYWWESFVGRIDDEVKLIGTTFNCHTGPKGWHLQSMTLATDDVGFNQIFSSFLKSSSTFDHKVDAIYGAEIPLSRAYLDAGYGLFALSSSTMLHRPIFSSPQDHVDVTKALCDYWRPQTTGQLGDPYHSSSPLVYPHEVVFFKTNIASHELLPSVLTIPLQKLDEEDTCTRPTCKPAICVSGELRSFDNPLVHESIISNVLEPLKWSSRQGCEAPALFFYISGTPSSKVDSALGNIYAHNPDIKIEFIYSSDIDVMPAPETKCSNPPSSVFHQFSKMQKCYRQVLHDELVSSSPAYTHILRLRPDMAFLSPIPDLSPDYILTPQNNFHPMNDQIAIVPRKLSDSYFNPLRTYHECGGVDSVWYPRGAGSPECHLWRHLNSTATPAKFSEIDAVIVRSGGEARCDSLVKTRNTLCQILEAFGRLGTSSDGNLCVDMFNAWMQHRCRNVFHTVSAEDQGKFAVGEAIPHHREPQWWVHAMSAFAATMVEPGRDFVKRPSEYYFVKDQEWHPLLITETSPGTPGRVTFGYAITSRLIDDAEAALKCEAYAALASHRSSSDVGGAVGASCGVHEAMGAVHRAEAWPPITCNPTCDERALEDLRARVSSRANEIAIG